MSDERQPGDVMVCDFNPEPFWFDREIRFDVTAQEYATRRGEHIIDTLDGVEDTKGNNGETGMLMVTNLRLLWHCAKDPKINLSIGLGCCLGVTIHSATSALRGHTQSLFVSSKFGTNRYEFTFTYLVTSSPRLFTTVTAVYKAYDTSRLYRDLKLRTAIIRDQDILLLPHEQLFSKLTGVWNLSSDQGNLGTMFITNVRVVWFANLAENFNVSIPYIQMQAVKVRESKFGLAFVIETTSHANSYVLGFRVDPAERIGDLFKEVSSLFQLYNISPILGVDFQFEAVPRSIDQNTVKRVIDGMDVIQEVATDSFAAYYADGGTKTADRKPVYDAGIGLAIEKLRDGVTLDSLWRIPNNDAIAGSANH